jgi:hypothetical protein
MKPRRAWVPVGVLGVVAIVVGPVASGCGASGSAAPPTTPGPPVTTPAPPAPTAATPAPTAAPAPATTVYAPTSPLSSPDAAAAHLVSAWAAGDRAEAARVATPAAVSTLFASPYPAGYIQPRGCTDASVNPGTCTYRNTQTNGIYEIGVSHVPAGWYVTSVTVES